MKVTFHYHEYSGGNVVCIVHFGGRLLDTRGKSVEDARRKMLHLVEYFKDAYITSEEMDI